MEIFASQNEKHAAFDETLPIQVHIETAKKIGGHTEYVLLVNRGYSEPKTWRINRRYNDFFKLHQSLQISGICLPLPGKQYFGNMKYDFIVERTRALQDYINIVLMNPILASSLPAKRFIDPESYSQSFQDHAAQNALMCMRNDCGWTLGPPMGAVGWRVKKYYFKALPKPPEKGSSRLLVKSSSQSQQNKYLGGNSSSNTVNQSMKDANVELTIEWLENGPDKYIDDKELGGILKSLMELRHEYIEPIVFAAHTDSGCLVIRKFYQQGSLKDILCMSTPKLPFLKKYGNPKGRTALSIKQVATFGKQILEALLFLHSKGYSYGHLHSGNVVIFNDSVKLLDVENQLVGVPAFYRPFFVQHSKINSTEIIDVYCFGHVLFEMSMGYPLQESVVRQITDGPESLRNLLESVLSKDACKVGLPTLQQLIAHRFFIEYAASNAKPDETVKSHFKLSLNAKEALKQASIRTEQRLRDEQKSVKNQKRTVRVQEHMSSEEEKRKSKQKSKLEHKQLKLRQQTSLQASNNGRLSISAGSSAAAVLNVAALSRTESVLSPEASFPSVQSPPPAPVALQQPKAMLVSGPSQAETSGATVTIGRQSSTPILPLDASEQQKDPPTRTELLDSICKFNRGSLRKVRSND